jgi:hypothetical protein
MSFFPPPSCCQEIGASGSYKSVQELHYPINKGRERERKREVVQGEGRYTVVVHSAAAP